MDNNITQKQVAEDLLWPIWRSLDPAYKERYKKEIWNQFENNVRAAAYCSNLNTFLENIKRKLHIVVEFQFVKELKKTIESRQDEIILNWLRSETTYLIMLVRLRNQERQEEYLEREK